MALASAQVVINAGLQVVINPDLQVVRLTLYQDNHGGDKARKCTCTGHGDQRTVREERYLSVPTVEMSPCSFIDTGLCEYWLVVVTIDFVYAAQRPKLPTQGRKTLKVFFECCLG